MIASQNYVGALSQNYVGAPKPNSSIDPIGLAAMVFTFQEILAATETDANAVKQVGEQLHLSFDEKLGFLLKIWRDRVARFSTHLQSNPISPTVQTAKFPNIFFHPPNKALFAYNRYA